MRGTYHCDADGVIKLSHTDTDEGRPQQQQDEGVLELSQVENTIIIYEMIQFYGAKVKENYPAAEG